MRLTEEQKHIEKIIVKAFDGNIQIGTAAVLIDPHIDGKPSALVESVEVIENRRRQGIGKMLMLYLIELANDRDCYKLVLQCVNHNVPFYKACGFHVHQNGMRRNLYEE